jgi:hypothetical protein
VGPFVFFLEKKLQIKKLKVIVILGIDQVHLALHEHILGTL